MKLDDRWRDWQDEDGYYQDLRNLGYKGDTLNRSVTLKEWDKVWFGRMKSGLIGM